MKPPFIFKNSETETEILIHEQIGQDWFSTDGLTSKMFAEELARVPASRPITVGLNSPGGNVHDGLAIYHLLRARPNVTVRVDGLAASIAAVIAMAGKVIHIPKTALMMIHRVWGHAQGNADEMLKMADDLQKHDQVVADIFASRTRQPFAEVFAAMSEETWFTGQEAVIFGLADAVLEVSPAQACFDLSRFKNCPAALAAASRAPTPNAPPDVSPASAPPLSIRPIGGLDTPAATPPPKPTTQNNMNDNTPLAATPAAPAIDFSPVISAIEGLRAALVPPTPPGAPPIPTRVENRGNPAIERYNTLEHGRTRSDFIRNHYADLSRSLLEFGVFKNANTVHASLANSLLSSDAVDTMRTALAPLGAFTRRVATSPISPRQVINVPLVSSVGSIQKNPSNFETGDTVAGVIAVTVDQYSKSWHCSHAEGNLGMELAAYAATNAMVLSEGVFALVTALMTNANYGADVVIGAAANFDSADLPAVLALGTNYKRVTLLLDGGHLAYLLPTTREHFAFGEPGAFGFDGGIYKNNLWTSAASDIAGFVCGADAICLATGQPAALPDGEIIVQETVTVGGGLAVTASTWFSRASRAMWGSYDVMFGCAVGDATQAEVLTTA